MKLEQMCDHTLVSESVSPALSLQRVKAARFGNERLLPPPKQEAGSQHLLLSSPRYHYELGGDPLF